MACLTPQKCDPQVALLFLQLRYRCPTKAPYHAKALQSLISTAPEAHLFYDSDILKLGLLFHLLFVP